jgi:hypothetical protein
VGVSWGWGDRPSSVCAQGVEARWRTAGVRGRALGARERKRVSVDAARASGVRPHAHTGVRHGRYYPWSLLHRAER